MNRKVLLSLIFLFVSVPAMGQRINLSGKDFLEKSNSIFAGKLVEKKSFRSEDGRFIYTRHVFKVHDSIKGNLGELFEITEYGGTVGDMTLAVSHNPSYAVGQDYLVFSYLDLERRNRTLGGPWGQLPVVSDKSGKQAVRLYSSHPLREVLAGEQSGRMHDLRELSGRLREAIKNLSNAK